jgi:hypothetical protein
VTHIDFSDDIEHIQQIIDSAVDEEVVELEELYTLLDQLTLLNDTKEENIDE